MIVERFVARGARLVHLVDFEGARQGVPANLEAVGRVASRVAVPLQLAGGLEGPDQIRLAFAAGATRVVLAMSVADDPPLLRSCLEVAGDWLAVGLDGRPERLAEYPWRRQTPPSLEGLLEELTGLGVRRFVIGHLGTDASLEGLVARARELDAEILVAGGISDVEGIRRLRHAGIGGVILGVPLLSGSIDFIAALEAAA